MKKTIPIIFFLLFLFVPFQIIFSQAVVVSEYYNASSVNDEWTELLVVGDNVSLVGYKLRDNVGTGGVPDNWQGGVEFADSPLWRNLRIGTVIVINHRGSGADDDDKSDGFIEVDADNPNYFIRRCWGCSLSFDWITKALVIAQTAEIIQILDANDNHIHALGHMASSAGDFPGIIGLKSSYKGTISGNTSVRITPGISLSYYNAGFDNNGIRTYASGQFVTKGLPNKRDAPDNQNELFWKSLRQPDWSNSALQASIVQDGIKLDWNKLAIPNPDDNNHGYIILRGLSAMITMNPPIEDGVVYQPGQKLDIWTVVTNINGANILTYTDKSLLGCNEEYTYFIFGFRYDNSNALIDEAPLGRSYNEPNFGKTSIFNENADSVEIFTKDGRTRFCDGDTVIIYSEIDGGPYTYSWFRNGIYVGDKKDSLKIRRISKNSSDTYRLIITSLDSSCIIESNELVITFEDKPEAKLFKDDGTEARFDDTIRLCTGEVYKLRASGGDIDSTDWYKDGILLIPDIDSITVTESGIYYAIASIQNACFDTTNKLTIIFQDFDFTLEDVNGNEPDTLKFYVYGTNNIDEKDIIIINNSDDTLVFNDNEALIFPKGFYEIISPQLPFIIPPNDSLTLRIRYENDQPGILTGKLIFNAPCDKTKEIILKGERIFSDIRQSHTQIDFGMQIKCSSKQIQKELTINIFGDKHSKFFQPSVFATFCS